MGEAQVIPIIPVVIAPTEAKAMVDALIDDIVDMAKSYACLRVCYRFFGISKTERVARR